MRNEKKQHKEQTFGKVKSPGPDPLIKADKGISIRDADVRSLSIDIYDLFEYSLDCVYIHDLEGNLIDANSEALELIGYSREELKSLKLSSFMNRQEQAKGLKAIDRMIKSGATRTVMELKLRHKNGMDIHIETKEALIYRYDKPFVILGICRDITERKKTDAFLKSQEEALKIKALQLEEINTALNVLLRQRQKEQIELEEKIMVNVRGLVHPYIEKLKQTSLNDHQKAYLELVESSLKEIVSPFSNTLKTKYLNLTPTEIRIADMIRVGKNSDEIGQILEISERTVEFHRNNIRSKLGVRNKKINLRTYLLTLQQ